MLLDASKGTPLRGKNVQEPLEMASLTKMYTFHCCLRLNEQLRITPYQTYVKTFETAVTGTSANLRP